MSAIKKALCAALPLFAGASAGGVISTELIDSVQPSVAEYIATMAGTAFVSIATYLTQKLGIKVMEYFNRQAVEMAAERFTNSVIDMLQDRFSRSAAPNVMDLVYDGIDYVKTGNPEATKAMTDDRLAVILKGKINKKAESLLASTLAKPPSRPIR